MLVWILAGLAVIVSLPQNAHGANESRVPADQLRSTAMHNAGRWFVPIGSGRFPISTGTADPETGASTSVGFFPANQKSEMMFTTSLMIGGISGDDTLLAMAYDYAYNRGSKFWAVRPDSGGFRRLGNLADDEFIGVYTDTITDPAYIGQPNPLDDTTYVPLGLKITQRSYSWADPAFDNILFLEFTLENIQDRQLRDVWCGLYMDPDVYYIGGGSNVPNGYADDVSGALDTTLYNGDPNSRVVIPYCYDKDGDPYSLGDYWNAASMRDIVSVAFLHSSFPVEHFNFNWWLQAGNIATDYGPRQVGTPEDPFRPFAEGNLGTARKSADIYYTLSHPEIDFNQIETAVIDTGAGWILPTNPESYTQGDTRFIYSFGPVNLAPGDTASFAIAIIGTDDFHVDAGDYTNYYDPYSPDEYTNLLAFDRLLADHRKADSLYRSGLTLPIPGPAAGLTVTDYNDSTITLTWKQSRHPNLAGYYISFRDTVYDDIWRHVHQYPVTDTVFTFAVSNPSHEHFFAVSQVDDLGRESARSFWTSVIPGSPHPPESLQVVLDGQIPVLSWQPFDNDMVQAFHLYRASEGHSFLLYDSTAAFFYRDDNVISGKTYYYYVRAVVDGGLPSAPSNTVSALPMAFDRQVLFCDLNADNTVHIDAYRKEYVDRLYASVESNIQMDYADIETDDISLPLISRYRIVVFDSEKGGGKFESNLIPVLSAYLTHGGKALFIIPSASTRSPGLQIIQKSRYAPGDFFYDVLKLDSAVTNAIVLSGGSIYGDLQGCQASQSGYPDLVSDMGKLAIAPLPISGPIPMSGCVFPRDGFGERLYTYESIYPDSSFSGQVNGFAYSEESYEFILYNFPLSLMAAPDNILAFRKALERLGIRLSCGDYDNDGSITIADAIGFINYLYRDGAPPPDSWRADINCDGAVDVGDALNIVNQVFRGGDYPACCPAE